MKYKIRKFLKLPSAFEWVICFFLLWLIYLINSSDFDAEQYDIFLKIFLSLMLSIMVISLFVNFSLKTSALCSGILICAFLIVATLLFIYDFVTYKENSFIFDGSVRGARIVRIIYQDFGFYGVLSFFLGLISAFFYGIIQAYNKLPVNNKSLTNE